jgi:predicted nuclease of predicted toxin-antitoxin system
MKFLVDAHLPRKLAQALRESGHDVLHTSELPDGNRTSDKDLNHLSISEQRTLITKDTEFVDPLLLHQKPHKLLLISTGNIRNGDLLQLFVLHLARIVDALEQHDFVELGWEQITVHW